MKQQQAIIVFGEVLFDCFSTGDQILGGAPFNVAWHLQAFGDSPKFISRVGDDHQGELITNAMTTWGMDCRYLQTDHKHPTGRVDVTVANNEPHYDIVKNAAYDFIEPIHGSAFPENGILYHGSLALRNEQSNLALDDLCSQTSLPIFIDVNLRDPWWQRHKIEAWLHRAHWAKLNEDELITLGFDNSDIKQAIIELQTQFNLEQVIITRGELGALVCTGTHDFHHVMPPKVELFIDTVGAGDAFTARYIHGLLHKEHIQETIAAAQLFAIKVIGLRGATSSDSTFY